MKDTADENSTVEATPTAMNHSNIENVPVTSPERVAVQDEQMDHAETDGAGDTDMGYIGSLEPDFDDFVSEMLLMSVASSGRNYGRETRAAHRRIVSGVYSHPGSQQSLRGVLVPTSSRASHST